MCKVYNTIGSLTAIKSQLKRNNIEDFNSVNDLIAFQNNYDANRKNILSEQSDLITRERNDLSVLVPAGENEIEQVKQTLQQKFNTEVEQLKRQFYELGDAEKTFIQEFTYSFKALFKLIKLNYIQLTSSFIIAHTIKPKVRQLRAKRERLQYLTTNFETAVKESCRRALQQLDHKKRTIDKVNSFIYGAIGEQKVAKELEKLSDDYILINDFSYTFERPLYYKEQQTKINTIQIDHVLVSPAGVFLIETKNWSKQSIQNLSLRSPVAQIQRTSFALFILINRTANFKLIPHHWGERKIPIKNLIVMINNKPAEEFQYVKVLTVDELLGYIKHFKPSLSTEGVQEIANYLVKINMVNN